MPQLAALFIVVQIIEIWLLIKVGQAIGGWQTLLLLVIDSLLGAWLLRREGRRTWRAFRLALDERRVPAREVADGVLVIIGGTLLLTPGFLSDVVGVLCLLPPTRAAIRPVLTRLLTRRLGMVGAVARGTSRRRTAPDVLEGEVVERTPPES
ncbi:MAG: protein FxsA [Actinomycetota bacterium]|jgi:UPF0716 protein FxsA|nr:protein FxsA [Actinomycetota bacterium]